jgi:hypothetical protein
VGGGVGLPFYIAWVEVEMLFGHAFGDNNKPIKNPNPRRPLDGVF